MTDLYTNECHFYADARSSNATNGWDAVYAIKYDAVNADIALRQPWADISADTTTTATYILTNLIVSSLALVVGDSAPDTDWEIKGTASYQDGTGTYTAAFVASYSAALAFSADPTTPGLHHLQVTAGTVVLTDFSVGAVTLDGSNGATTITLSADVIQQLKSLVDQTIQAATTTLFANSLASVLNKDYAESANVPWLVPGYFTYALGTMPNDSTDGLLAILSTSKTGAALNALSASFNSNLFPIDSDINAAVFISSSVLGQETFGELLNQRAAKSVIGSLKSDPANGSVYNVNDVPLLFKYDSTTGVGAFISTDAGADFSGKSYPAAIPAGQLAFRIGTDAINVDVNRLTVSLGGGMTLDVVMNMSFALIANSTSNEIDVALNGEPTITTHFNTSEAGGLETFANIASVVASTLAAEALAFVVDRFTSSLTSLSDAKLRQYQHDFFAAAAQSEKERRPVSFSIGWDKEMVVNFVDERPGSVSDASATPAKLKSSFKSQLQLGSELTLDIGNDAPAQNRSGAQVSIELPLTEQASLVNNISGIHGAPVEQGNAAPARQSSRKKILRPGLGGLAAQIKAAGAGRICGVDRFGDGAEPLGPQQHMSGVALDANSLNEQLQQVAEAQLSAQRRETRGIVDRFCGTVVERARGMVADRARNNESAFQINGYGALFKEFVDGTRAGSSISGLSVDQCRALYAACARFMNNGYSNGSIDATGYLETVRQYNLFAAAAGTPETRAPLIGSVRPPDRDAYGNTYRAGYDDAGGYDQEPLLPENWRDNRLDNPQGTGTRYTITTRTRFFGSDAIFSRSSQARQGLLDEIALTTNAHFGIRYRGSPTATAALVGDVIRDARRPAWSWFWGLSWYVAGLAGGYFAGNAAAQGISDLFFEGGDKARQNAPGVMASVLANLNTGPAAILFSRVTFPLMTQFITGTAADSAMPQPVTVLKRASVNGALILGVEIALSLP